MKIIVVDDEPLIRDTLVNILAGEGHEAMAVPDGVSAIKWAGTFRPDAVVTDVAMPGMDGVETAKEIAKLLPGCRIILFSGQAASSGVIARALAEGCAFEVLAKPVNPGVLIEKLKAPPITNAH